MAAVRGHDVVGDPEVCPTTKRMECKGRHAVMWEMKPVGCRNARCTESLKPRLTLPNALVHKVPAYGEEGKYGGPDLYRMGPTHCRRRQRTGFLGGSTVRDSPRTGTCSVLHLPSLAFSETDQSVRDALVSPEERGNGAADIW